jgi:hypothetical protein
MMPVPGRAAKYRKKYWGTAKKNPDRSGCRGEEQEQIRHFALKK